MGQESLSVLPRIMFSVFIEFLEYTRCLRNASSVNECMKDKEEMCKLVSDV